MVALEILSWVVASLSLYGCILNIYESKWCWVCWFVADSCWVAIDMVAGLTAQAVLMVVYCHLNIFGYIKWRERDASHP
jgi:hypothetical protein